MAQYRGVGDEHFDLDKPRDALRYVAHYIGDKGAPSEIFSCLEKALRALSRLEKAEAEVKEAHKELIAYAAEINNLRAELAALKELHRWRKWPEEALPFKDMPNVFQWWFDDGSIDEAVKMECCYSSKTKGGKRKPTHWRPIFGPEEGK